MLTIKDLSIKSSEQVLLDNFNLSVDKGELVGLIGASGSGKSILFQAIQGTLPSSFDHTGSIEFMDEAPKQTALIAQHSGVLNPNLTIGKQLHLFAGHQGDIDRYLKQLKLDLSIKEQYPYQLSGGMLKRILTCLALIQDTPYLLADEPACGLDHDNAVLLYQCLRQQNHKGVIVISHDLDLLVNYVDRIVVLNKGIQVDNTTPSAILTGQCQSYTCQLWQALPQHWESCCD
ncbi:TPA: ATP-binding cassette domain-containing protein [Photobacterium damselae]